MTATTSPIPKAHSPTSNGSHESKLPRWEAHPDRDVVIYDGDCKFCQAQVERLAWIDGNKHLAFVSLHDPEVAKQFPDLSHDMLMKEMYIVDQQGRRHAGALAFRYLSRKLPWLYPLAVPMHIPFSAPVWKWLYGQVAKRRYWLGGKREECESGACKLH